MAIDWIALFVALPIAILAIAFIVMWRVSRSQRTDERQEENNESKTLWGVTIALSVLYLMAGLPKLAGMDTVLTRFSDWGYSEDFMIAIGIVEMFGAVMLMFKRTASVAAAILATVMIGALYTHVMAGEFLLAPLPFVALIGLAYVGYERFKDTIFLPGPRRRGSVGGEA